MPALHGDWLSSHTLACGSVPVAVVAGLIKHGTGGSVRVISTIAAPAVTPMARRFPAGAVQFAACSQAEVSL